MSDGGKSPDRSRQEDGEGDADEPQAAAADDKVTRKDEDLEERHEDRKKSSRDKDRKKDRRRSRSRDSRSRSRDRDRRDRRRSRSRDRGSRRSSGRDRDRSRSRSRDRDRHSKKSSRRDRSNSRSRRRSRSRSRSPSEPARSRKAQPLLQPPQQMAPAAVAIGPGTGHDPFAALRQQQFTPVDPMEIQRMWQEQQLKARQLVLQQQAASAAQAASKTQREIYVGNLVPGAISEVMLQQIFNTALMVRFPGCNTPGMEPVMKANVHSSGKYCFLEFRTPEMATAALDLNGQVQFMGQAMSVNRPSGYVDPQKAAVAAAAASQALTAFQRGDPTALQSAGQSGANLGALTGIRPATAFSGPLSAAGALASAAVAQSVAVAMLPGPPAMAPTPAPAVAAAVPGVPTTSTCVCVTGMVTAATLQDDSEYMEVISDLREECSKHGTVLDVKVPRPPQPELSAQVFGTGNYGKGLVQFADVASAEAAKAAIHGRMFAGSMVQAVSFPPEAFAML